MLDRLSFLSVLAQAAPAAPGGPAGPAESLWLMTPFLLIGVLFYFLLVVPERRKARDLDQMLKNLKKNDRVVTAGGILGLVVNAAKDSDEVVVRVDENNNTRIHVLRSSIVRVLGADAASESKDA
jgi:preprotein translocase subunit YajC